MGQSSAIKPSRPVLCLAGPTAVGKTALAVELVQRLPLQIINVDSAQIYRGMDIGTGKPDQATLARAPHRLIDFLDPAQSYSAASFRTDAIREITDILQNGKIPLLVGGTMLYFKALRDGLAPLPAADPRLRQQIELEADQIGWAGIHRRLAEVDPAAAQRIHPNDPQRLQRALEVYLLTGKSLSHWHRQQGVDGQPPFDLHFFSIQPGLRSVLHEKISKRFDKMLKAGLLAEVEMLYRRPDLHAGLPALRSVGYRQVWQYLGGEISYDEMRERGIIATRQLAKRQITWLRSWPNLRNYDSDNPQLLDQVLKSLEAAAIVGLSG
ncbi:MAG: tRNA (adenosine(37)-N6)-dimethylallyltransferase MiaA [Pseudomonadales bacterium]|nr:tRNA (adenosine(37)-N6)-dimethylallyltransferase MiaA [Pseudomonadales bacterium]